VREGRERERGSYAIMRLSDVFMPDIQPNG
jgi:hypothetical protein